MPASLNSKHTNSKWYAYPELGSYFKIQDGQLLQLPMLVDGTPGAEEGAAEVDWDRIDDRERLDAIREELLTKP